MRVDECEHVFERAADNRRHFALRDIAPGHAAALGRFGLLQGKLEGQCDCVGDVTRALIETGVSLSNTITERVSDPMLANTTPAVFCALVRVTRLAAKGDAMTPSTSTPAASTASMRSS